MNVNSRQNMFIQGAIPPDFIMQTIREHKQNDRVGAYSIFIGQVRSDEIDGSRVSAVEFSTQSQMAIERFNEIRDSLFKKYPVTTILAYHSVGKVLTGEICFFVLSASGHRAEAISACNEAVERIKAELAIWGKLFLENGTIKWKENN